MISNHVCRPVSAERVVSGFVSSKLSRTLLRRLILASQKVDAFRARGSYSGLAKQPGGAHQFAEATCEFDDSLSLLQYLQPFNLQSIIANRTVLDYGSGYGGRTVWMAQTARSVRGVEIFPSMVEKSQVFAAFKNATNVEFSLGSEERILFEDGSFDVVVSFDVLEHVANPGAILREMYRVLKPGGTAVIVFTPYFGAFAHHLNYITLLPGLHWLWRPETLIAVVNDMLDEEPCFRALGVQRQAAPRVGHNGWRRVLPTLNGLTKSDFVKCERAAGFRRHYLCSTPILDRYPLGGPVCRLFNRALARVPVVDELVSINLVSVLGK